MGKLFVVQCVNGNMSIVSEWVDNENGAKQAFHNTCKNLWASSDVITGMVAILDTQLDVFQGYKEFISHPVTE